MPQTHPTAHRIPAWDDDEELFAEPISVGTASHLKQPANGVERRPFEQSAVAARLAAGAHQQPIGPVPIVAVGPAKVRRAGSGRAVSASVPARSRPAWLWAVAGFIVGIVFWHLIGFWDFVSQTVLPPAAKRGAAGAADKVSGGSDVLVPSHSFFPARVAKPRLAQSGTAAAAGKPGVTWSVTVTEDAPAPSDGSDVRR